MPELTDYELLTDFARNESEQAFTTLVDRYVNLVYSAALRFTGNSHHAEEITQAVFIILARKAGKISPRVVLSGWLYQTARLTSANFVKGEVRRQRREQEAYMQSTLIDPGSETWQQIAPLLDDAMGSLSEADRNALVLRFFENKTAAQVATALNVSEAAAHKRTARSLEKLRKLFFRRGVSSTTAIIGQRISAHSVQAAPLALAKSVTAVALIKGTVATGSTLTLVKGTLKLMAWTKAKTAVLAAGGLLLLGTGIVLKSEFFPSEPSYQGRRLSEWLVDVDYGQPQDKRAKAGEAIRKMGTKTLPFLIADLTPDKKPKDNSARQATWAFDALGPIGKSAIPKLSKLSEANPGFVPPALAGIGRDALPELLSYLTNESFWVRDNSAAALANAIFSEKIKPDEASAAFPIALDNLTYESTNSLFQANTRSRAAWLLAALKKSPEVSVPALIHGLQDSNFTVASDCAFALSQFGKDAKVAIPELTQAANSTNNQLSVMANQSLKGIQNAR